jgi:TRAP transporter 4TM/12TM fusion protein
MTVKETADHDTGILIKMIKILVAATGIGISLFHLYTGAFGVFDAYMQRSVHLMTLMSLAFLVKPTFKSWSARKNAVIDLPLAILCLLIGVYLFVHHGRLVTREWYWGPMTSLDIGLGILTILLVLESARRTVGPALPIIAIVFMAYALFGGYLPYPFTIREVPPLIFLDHTFLTTQAIFGVPTGVSATFVFLFILFAAFLQKTGAAQFIIDFSMALVGKTTGGPAKVSIVASSLFGTVSGHSVANVYGTGTITIPLMKRAGYKPEFAGAVEAAASSGGQIMPPIMGAAAFIMAEILGVSYLSILKAALIPALLYYVALFVSCHIEALKMNISGIELEEAPKMRTTLANGSHFFIPLILLVAVLVANYTPFRAALIAIIALWIVSAFRKSSRLSIRDYFEAFIDGAKNSVVIAVACACAGIVVGVLDVTGVGIKFVTIVTSLSMGNLFLALVLVMLSCLILGMGVPTAPAYIVAAMIAAPILIGFGVDPIAAHMFVFYSALLSAITPPVALAAYAGAAIAEGKVMETAVIASKLGIVKFVIPYMFVYNTALLLAGSLQMTILSVFTAVIGTVSLSIATEGYVWGKLKPLMRLLFLAAGLAALMPEVVTDLIGVAGVAVLCLVAYRNRSRVAGGEKPGSEVTRA